MLRWKLLQHFVQDFWRRWKEEYLDQMLVRTKWKGTRRNAAEDDVVLVRSENTPPTQWPLGRVTATYPGNDGLLLLTNRLYLNIVSITPWPSHRTTLYRSASAIADDGMCVHCGGQYSVQRQANDIQFCQ